MLAVISITLLSFLTSPGDTTASGKDMSNAAMFPVKKHIDQLYQPKESKHEDRKGWVEQGNRRPRVTKPINNSDVRLQSLRRSRS